MKVINPSIEPLNSIDDHIYVPGTFRAGTSMPVLYTYDIIDNILGLQQDYINTVVSEISDDLGLRDISYNTGAVLSLLDQSRLISLNFIEGRDWFPINNGVIASYDVPFIIKVVDDGGQDITGSNPDKIEIYVNDELCFCINQNQFYDWNYKLIPLQVDGDSMLDVKYIRNGETIYTITRQIFGVDCDIINIIRLYEAESNENEFTEGMSVPMYIPKEEIYKRYVFQNAYGPIFASINIIPDNPNHAYFDAVLRISGQDFPFVQSSEDESVWIPTSSRFSGRGDQMVFKIDNAFEFEIRRNRRIDMEPIDVKRLFKR